MANGNLKLMSMNDKLTDDWSKHWIETNVFYHNNQDGTFSVSEYSETLSLPHVPSGGAVWADYDNDG